MKWFIQVYDEKGLPCKMLREFEGTKKEVEEYVNERFGLVDTIWGRTTIIYKNKKDVKEKLDGKD